MTNKYFLWLFDLINPQSNWILTFIYYFMIGFIIFVGFKTADWINTKYLVRDKRHRLKKILDFWFRKLFLVSIVRSKVLFVVNFLFYTLLVAGSAQKGELYSVSENYSNFKWLYGNDSYTICVFGFVALTNLVFGLYLERFDKLKKIIWWIPAFTFGLSFLNACLIFAFSINNWIGWLFLLPCFCSFWVACKTFNLKQIQNLQNNFAKKHTTAKLAEYDAK